MASKNVDYLYDCIRNGAQDFGGSDLWSPKSVTLARQLMPAGTPRKFHFVEVDCIVTESGE